MGVSLFGFGYLSILGLSVLFERIFSQTWISNPFVTLSVTTVLFVFLFKPIDAFFSEIFKHYLFKKHSFAHMMLMNLAEELEHVVSMKELSNLVVNTFADLLQLKTVALLVRDAQQKGYYVVSAAGWHVSDYRKVWVEDSSLLLDMVRNEGPHVLVRNRTVPSLEWKDANMLASQFDALRANWIVPLTIKEDVPGLLVFSSFDPERVFIEADFQFFRKFGKIIAQRVATAMKFEALEIENERLKDAQSQILQRTKLAAIEQLATGIAHQIHNPLTIISGKAQVLLLQKDRVPLDDRIQDVLKTIVKQTKRAADITKKLLVFSQGSSGSREYLQLDQILEDTIALVSYQTSLERISLTKTVDSDLPDFLGNLQEMREMFFNLILNAVQSVGSEGKIHVQMTHQKRDDIIEIGVSDSGRGIARDHIDKLFNPFFTTRHEALGLGLFVTKQIVHRLGGSIRVDSELEEGSLFTVRLPCSQEQKRIHPGEIRVAKKKPTENFSQVSKS